MAQILVLLYGVACYAFFFVTFLYAIAFVSNLFVSPTLDGPATRSLMESLLIDGGFLALFAVQHSVMARQWFKKAWTQIVPHAAERSTYVLLSSLILYGMFRNWQPIEPVVYEVTNPTGSLILTAIGGIGWLLVLASTFMINHFDLFGLRQVYYYFRGQAYSAIPFRQPAVYNYVRHPIYLGFILAFWGAPRMTAGHLFFAGMCTAYILVAIQFEERDMIRFYGDQYRSYRERVSMLIPLPGKPSTAETDTGASAKGKGAGA